VKAARNFEKGTWCEITKTAPAASGVSSIKARDARTSNQTISRGLPAKFPAGAGGTKMDPGAALCRGCWGGWPRNYPNADATKEFGGMRAEIGGPRRNASQWGRAGATSKAVQGIQTCSRVLHPAIFTAMACSGYKNQGQFSGPGREWVKKGGRGGGGGWGKSDRPLPPKVDVFSAACLEKIAKPGAHVGNNFRPRLLVFRGGYFW